MKRFFTLACPAIMITILVLVYGCGDTNLFESLSDDDSEQARLEDVRQYLNDGKFDKVIAELGGKDLASLSEEELRYLASAYLGKAGFDTLSLLNEFAKEDEGESVEVFGVITSLFDPDGEGISEEELSSGDPDNPSKLEYIDKALEVLSAQDMDLPEGLFRQKAGQVSNDIRLQRGIYAAVHAVLSISLGIYNQYYLDPGLPNIPLSIDALCSLRNLLPQKTISLTNAPSTLNRDLLLIKKAIEAIDSGDTDGNVAEDPVSGGDENHFRREFNQFLVDIYYFAPAGSEPGVDGAELSAYLNGLLAASCPN